MRNQRFLCIHEGTPATFRWRGLNILLLVEKDMILLLGSGEDGGK
jgi:hypothetical protein